MKFVPVSSILVPIEKHHASFYFPFHLSFCNYHSITNVSWFLNASSYHHLHAENELNERIVSDQTMAIPKLLIGVTDLLECEVVAV